LALEGEIDVSRFKNTGVYPRVANQILSTAKLNVGRDKRSIQFFYFVRKIVIQKGVMQILKFFICPTTAYAVMALKTSIRTGTRNIILAKHRL